MRPLRPESVRLGGLLRIVGGAVLAFCGIAGLAIALTSDSPQGVIDYVLPGVLVVAGVANVVAGVAVRRQVRR